MANQRPFVFQTTTSVTVTSSWYRTDYRFNDNPERAYFATQTSGGRVICQVAVSVSDDSPTIIGTVVSTTSASLDGVIHGSWPMIRFIAGGGDTGATVVLVG